LRLQAFIKARHAFYGSLLMGLLTHHLSHSAASAEGVGAAAAHGSEFDVLEQVMIPPFLPAASAAPRAHVGLWRT